MFVLWGSVLIKLRCSSFVLHQISPLLLTSLEEVSLDVQGACAALLG